MTQAATMRGHRRLRANGNYGGKSMHARIRRYGTQLIMLACCSTLGCGGEETTEHKEKVTIGWLAKGAKNDFFDLSRHAAALAAQDLSSASGREVEVVLLDSDDATADAQKAKLDEAIAMGVDALAVSVLDPAVVGPSIDHAIETGIPVITFDSDAPDSERVSFYGISNLEGAKVAAKVLADQIGGKGKVAIMTAAGSTPGTLSTSQTYRERMTGFEDTMAGYPGIEIVSVTTCAKDDETNKAGCTQILEEVMAAHPDIVGWYLARGRVLREAKLETLAPTWSARVLAGDMKVVGFDAPQDALHSVKSGLVQALVTQDYFGWGYDVVSLLFDVVTIDRKLSSFTDSKFDLVCGNNINQLMSMWDAKDFRSTLTKCDLLR
jgi:ribose transport system substrate-binding protein